MISAVRGANMQTHPKAQILSHITPPPRSQRVSHSRYLSLSVEGGSEKKKLDNLRDFGRDRTLLPSNERFHSFA